MDAMTTSLAKSCNHALKNSSHSNMNFDKTYAKVLEGVKSRIQNRRNTPEQEMATFNYASNGTTKDIMIAKGQGLLVREYNNRMKSICAQMDESTFVCWNFVNENLGEDNYGWPWSGLTQFHNTFFFGKQIHQMYLLLP